MRWPMGERLGFLGRQLQAPSDRPGGGKVGDGGQCTPSNLLESTFSGFAVSSFDRPRTYPGPSTCNLT